MDSIEKLRVLLQHWIDHNGGHVNDFAKWQKIMTEENNDQMASALSEAMKRMDQVSEVLQKALDDIGGPSESSEHHHHHHHH
jgi:hypothetical protein